MDTNAVIKFLVSGWLMKLGNGSGEKGGENRFQHEGRRQVGRPGPYGAWGRAEWHDRTCEEDGEAGRRFLVEQITPSTHTYNQCANGLYQTHMHRNGCATRVHTQDTDKQAADSLQEGSQGQVIKEMFGGFWERLDLS